MQRQKAPRKPSFLRTLIGGLLFLMFLFGPMVVAVMITGEDSGVIYWAAVYGPYAILIVAAAWSSPFFPKFGRGGRDQPSFMHDADD